MAEEEAAFVAAHVAVADGVAVDDLFVVHVLPHLRRLVLVDPLRKAPVLLPDLPVACTPGGEGGGYLFERLVEAVVVEEDPVVVVVFVEAVLDLPDAAGDFPDVAVAREGDEGGVHAHAGGGGVVDVGFAVGA